jgi:ATP adenylyltransferase/5',5'''-P-1,P-4-tetraphosphate phosphorylase II
VRIGVITFRQFEFRVCDGWKNKPMTVDANLQKTAGQVEPERFGPGSDIYRSDPEQVVEIIDNAHILALNIYPVYRPQYLVLSLDSYRRQDEPLDPEMLDAAWKVLELSKPPSYAMYNCGSDAGCSRNHKHMQILPMPKSEDGFSFFPDREDGYSRVPYAHFMHYFNSPIMGRLIDGKQLHEIYLRLLRLGRQVMRIAEDDKETFFPHNVILVQEWMLLIPRRKRAYNGLSANAAGMMGMVVVQDEADLEKWTDSGPAKVLSELGIAVDHS